MCSFSWWFGATWALDMKKAPVASDGGLRVGSGRLVYSARRALAPGEERRRRLAVVGRVTEGMGETCRVGGVVSIGFWGGGQPQSNGWASVPAPQCRETRVLRGRCFSGNSEPVESFSIFNTEKERGPRRTAENCHLIRTSESHTLRRILNPRSFGAPAASVFLRV